MKIKRHHNTFRIIVGVITFAIIATLAIGTSHNKKTKLVNTTQIPRIEIVNYSNTASKDNIIIDLPFPGAVTGKTFSVIGKARGTWFFEASFPVLVLDTSGKEIAHGVAVAGSDWMTTEFVPFKADIQIPESYMGKATLVLKKDNPSGLTENDASASFSFTIQY